MSERILKATHEGGLKIGNISIPCAVLEDGTRVLSQSKFLVAIGRSRTPKAGTGASVDNTPTFLAAKNLNTYVGKEISVSTTPVKFIGVSGITSYGYNANLLTEVCQVYLAARKDKALLPSQYHIADACEILMRGFAHVGIIALIDEATGYQKTRARMALEEILDEFISKELRKWTKTFPDEFYEQLFKLRGWDYREAGIKKRPSVVGRWTNDLIYERLAPCVLKELRRLNPKTPSGTRPHRHFQYLTEDIGHPKLREHLASTIALMRASTTWRQFMRNMVRAFPKFGDQNELDFMQDEEDDGK